MCRHLAYLGPPLPLADVVTRPAKGLYEQSWAPRLQRYGTVNADGFGLGWYPHTAQAADAAADPSGPHGTAAPGDEWRPARYRRAVPVWADTNLPDLTRAVRSGAVLAAVRDATEGTAQEETAAAPYAHGRWLFSHNGAVRDWEDLLDDLGERVPPGRLLGLESRCDSALLWTLLTRHMDAGEPVEEALASLTVRVSRIRPDARLNFLLTDGSTILATRRGDTLWYRTGPQCVWVASEPDAGDDRGDDRGDNRGDNVRQRGPDPGSEAGWQEVPEESLLVATATTVRTVPLVHASERIPIA
ncbi:class II glutamine amidotransferase [Streptomyces ovatisporus]|uniref:Gamma-glutamyl-hercynylcysteine sulfoxide hydrolase n=1 Tax=Streptomyces ovatisporus TaxID=1128682 RepID=A0ABV9A7W4_9ACTN